MTFGSLVLVVLGVVAMVGWLLWRNGSRDLACWLYVLLGVGAMVAVVLVWPLR